MTAKKPPWERRSRRLTDRELRRIRRALGIPDDGPTEAQRERWSRQETRT